MLWVISIVFVGLLIVMNSDDRVDGQDGKPLGRSSLNWPARIAGLGIGTLALGLVVKEVKIWKRTNQNL